MSLPYQDASAGARCGIRTPTEFRKIHPARLRRGKWRDPGAARVLRRSAVQGVAVSHQSKSGFLRMSLGTFSDANLTQEAN